MPTDKETNRTQRATSQEDDQERGSTVHGGGLGGNELGSRESAVGTVSEKDLTPGERRRGGQHVETE